MIACTVVGMLTVNILIYVVGRASGAASTYADHSTVPHATDEQIPRCVDGPVRLARAPRGRLARPRRIDVGL